MDSDKAWNRYFFVRNNAPRLLVGLVTKHPFDGTCVDVSIELAGNLYDALESERPND